ncbi:dihydrofolate reductase family protein [Streptosporangiaceae bacterium NEAU-GS5]|nr:dihydrofolate reductase family protein [Streptosporangiaceae bacterium NEAU-GS5]
MTVLWHVTMSLDGYIAGPKGEVDWLFANPGTSTTADEVIRTTGAFLAGRRSLDLAPEGSKAYGGAWTGPVFVLTHRPPAVVDPSITILSGDIKAAVATATAAAGDRNLVITGANVARQALEADLIDEILVHLSPVLLGSGTRLFDRSGYDWLPLEKISVTDSGPVTDLRFRVPH